jgi:hypothetical protein
MCIIPGKAFPSQGYIATTSIGSKDPSNLVKGSWREKRIRMSVPGKSSPSSKTEPSKEQLEIQLSGGGEHEL